MLLGGKKKKKIGPQLFPLRALGEEQTGNVRLMLLSCYTSVQFMWEQLSENKAFS